MADTALIAAALQSAAAQPWALQESHAATVSTLVTEAMTGTLRQQALAPDTLAVALGRSRSAPVQGTAVVPVRGMILYDLDLPGFATGMRQLARTIRELTAAKNVRSIILDIKSPGGTVTGVPEAAAAIRAARSVKPVIAIANPFAASAAYWLAAQASELIVVPSGDVGSIGVFMLHVDMSQALDNAGIKPTFIKAGTHKTEGNPFEPLDSGARKFLQGQVGKVYTAFLLDVALGRRTDIGTVREKFGQGRMIMAKDAVRLGMADRTGTIDDVLALLHSGASATGPGAGVRATLRPVDLARQRRLEILRNG